MVTTEFSQTFHFEPICDSTLSASYHMLAYCHKHSSEQLHLMLHVQNCCQYSDAAQETLSDSNMM